MQRKNKKKETEKQRAGRWREKQREMDIYRETYNQTEISD